MCFGKIQSAIYQFWYPWIFWYWAQPEFEEIGVLVKNLNGFCYGKKRLGLGGGPQDKNLHLQAQLVYSLFSVCFFALYISLSCVHTCVTHVCIYYGFNLIETKLIIKLETNKSITYAYIPYTSWNIQYIHPVCIRSIWLIVVLLIPI